MNRSFHLDRRLPIFADTTVHRNASLRPFSPEDPAVSSCLLAVPDWFAKVLFQLRWAHVRMTTLAGAGRRTAAEPTVPQPGLK